MLADIKLSKAQISKIIQSGGSFGSWLSNLRNKALKNISIPLARGNLPGLVNNLTSSEINEFDRKISGKGAARSGKGCTLFISNEDMNGIIKIIKSIEYLGILTDEVTKKVKHKIKKKTRRWISWSFVSIFSRFLITASNFFCSKTYKRQSS